MDINNYEEVFSLAGARVILYEESGGEWLAYLHYEDKCGWAKGSFGCCSNCDELYSLNYYYNGEEKIEKCKELGLSLLEDILNDAEIKESSREEPYSLWFIERAISARDKDF